MKIKNLILCAAMALMMASCSTKQSAISQLEDFSYELRDHSRYYNTNDWEKAGKKFVNIREKTPIRVVRNIQDVSKFFSLMERSASSSASALTMGKNWIISVVTLLR